MTVVLLRMRRVDLVGWPLWDPALVSSEVLRVVQLNMDSIFGPRWPDRRMEVVTWLDYLDADVVCLQEVWEDHRRPNTGGWIAEHLNGVWHCAFEGSLCRIPKRLVPPFSEVRFRDPEQVADRCGRVDGAPDQRP